MTERVDREQQALAAASEKLRDAEEELASFAARREALSDKAAQAAGSGSPEFAKLDAQLQRLNTREEELATELASTDRNDPSTRAPRASASRTRRTAGGLPDHWAST